MKFRPTRKKIGKVIYFGKEFPIWLDNSVAIDFITIKIFDDGRLDEHILAASGVGLSRKTMEHNSNKFLVWRGMDIKAVRDWLRELQNHIKAEIDWNKVDDFLFKIEKLMIIKRLGGDKE